LGKIVSVYLHIKVKLRLLQKQADKRSGAQEHDKRQTIEIYVGGINDKPAACCSPPQRERREREKGEREKGERERR
jgi:hypothetical protein